MAEVFKTVKGLVESKINQGKTSRRLANSLVNKIGIESEIGRKNQKYYYGETKKMIDAGKPNEAVSYARKERGKVLDEEKMEKEKQKNIGKLNRKMDETLEGTGVSRNKRYFYTK